MKISLKILLILFLIGCSEKPNPDGFRYKIQLYDKKYDIALYRDRGGVFAPDYCDIYMDFRNGKFKKVFSFNLNDFAFKMIRFDTNTVAFIKNPRRVDDAPDDTVFFKLE